MQKNIRKQRAHSLRAEAEAFGRALLELRGTVVDAASRQDRIYVCDEALPCSEGEVSGGARFDQDDRLRNLGLRQTSGRASVELTLRNVRGKVSVMKKIIDPYNNYAEVATAVFSPRGKVIRYAETTVNQ